MEANEEESKIKHGEKENLFYPNGSMAKLTLEKMIMRVRSFSSESI